MGDTTRNSDNSHDANTIDYEKILYGLYKLLGDGSWGNYTEKHTIPTGVEVIYHVSWATGMHTLSELSKYRRKYDNPPAWLSFCDPSHRIKLCEIALKTNIRLPESFNQLIAYIQLSFEDASKGKLISNEIISCDKTQPAFVIKGDSFRRSDGTVTLEEALPVLVKSKKLLSILRKEFGLSKAKVIISMMREGAFSGDVGDELYVFLIDQIHNESETMWNGVSMASDNEYAIGINGYCGIYYVWEVEMDEVGFFLDIEHARLSIPDGRDYIIDTTTVVTPRGFKAITFKKVLPILVKRMRLLDSVRKKYGSSKADQMTSMIKNGIFSGEIGCEIKYILIKIMSEHWKLEWDGYIDARDDEEIYSDYKVEIYGNHGVYYVQIQRCGSYGYFMDLEHAKSFVFSKDGIRPNYL